MLARLCLFFTALCALGAAQGCFLVLDNDLPVSEPERFIALTRDFAGFTSWPSVDVGTTPIEGHPTTGRTVYLNMVPDSGADHFPVGTIFVKTGAGAETTGGTGDQIHAMVKRGGGFNASGAVGWEWVELTPSTTGVPVIVWRGFEPPTGEGYGCLPGQACGANAGDCNGCHNAHAANDYVQSAPLQLDVIQQTFASATFTAHGAAQ